MTQSRIISLLREQRSMGFLMLWMAVVPLASSVGATYVLLGMEEEMAQLSQWQWWLFYLATVFTMGFAITPTTYIALLSGYFIGWESLPFVIVAYQLASLLGYCCARLLSRNFVSGIIGYYPKSEVYFQNVNRKQLTTTVLSRISPALPFALMNVALSAAHIRLAAFFWGGLMGMLPRTVFFLWVGSQAQYFSEALQGHQGVLWSVVLSILGIYLLYRVIKSGS